MKDIFYSGTITDLLKYSNEEIFKSGSPFSFQYVAHGKPKTVVYWLAELKDPEKAVTLSHEHKDYKWLPCAEAGDLAKFQETKKLINACEEFLKNISQK